MTIWPIATTPLIDGAEFAVCYPDGFTDEQVASVTSRLAQVAEWIHQRESAGEHVTYALMDAHFAEVGATLMWLIPFESMLREAGITPTED